MKFIRFLLGFPLENGKLKGGAMKDVKFMNGVRFNLIFVQLIEGKSYEISFC